MRDFGDNAGAETNGNQQPFRDEGEVLDASTHNQVALSLDSIEAAMLCAPQVECSVQHHFGPGIYIREVTIPAGTLAVGHAQKYEHLNIVLQGKVAVVEGGGVKVIEAPAIFVGMPGRQFGYVLETCVWQNVYATTETDIEKLEQHFIDKSEVWEAQSASIAKHLFDAHAADREDFYSLVSDYGFDLQTVRTQSERSEDQIPMPCEWVGSVSIRKSAIEGMGVFTSRPIKSGEVICPAKICGFRTPAGRYANHSKIPNAKFVKLEDEDVFLVALSDIQGSLGGGFGDEITVDYRQALSLAGVELKKVDAQ